jgi:hypothetical protein
MGQHGMRPAFAAVGSPLGLVTDADAYAEAYAYGVVNADLWAGWEAVSASESDVTPPNPSLDELCVGVVLFTGRSSGPRRGFA